MRDETATDRGNGMSDLDESFIEDKKAGYHGFTKLIQITTWATVVVLVLMALFLL